MEAIKNCATGELILNVKSKTPRFKAGADLSTHVNLVDVTFNQEHQGDFLLTDLKLHLQMQECTAGVRPILK
jgi:hypothetical protein